ncbi:hypothetical protein IB265_32725 [Ensifer sp. ENS10]|uniref:hypothetical protein n=1 Tax=Ensifer sp. ENS10 TaxID=2769286 RepID=UPI00177EEF14|nr:hypothetical protein [Ensifer sp. ENS10]MBD9511522.1 hypothetical protein [Ensifer sp. ENS10]
MRNIENSSASIAASAAVTIGSVPDDIATLEAALEAFEELDLLDRIVVTQETMTVSAFVAIKEHPRQRDTERHLKLALKKHLSAPSPVHSRVNVAVLDGTKFKLDGHTRSLAWDRGLLKAPSNVKADVYHCETMDDLLELYTHFDNKSAVETTPDKLSGALRQAGITVTSEALAKYSFATALQVASRSVGGESTDLYKNAEEFKAEIATLDAIMPVSSIFRVGVIAGAIMLLRKHGDKIKPFLKALNENTGVKTPNECDPAYALTDLILRQAKGRGGFSRTLELAGKTISCGDRALRGENYAVTPKGVSVKVTKISGYCPKTQNAKA